MKLSDNTGARVTVVLRWVGVPREIRWTVDREEHIARHNVAPGEVEELLTSRPLWLETKGDVVVVAGVVASGRYLLAVVIPQDHQGATFIVTARDMTSDEKRIYRRKAR